jgi:hypothetical protein
MEQLCLSLHLKRTRWLAVGIVFLWGLGLSGSASTIYAGLGTSFIWVGRQSLRTTSLAWGDWNTDGDLDLAVGNSGQVNQVYENDRETST